MLMVKMQHRVERNFPAAPEFGKYCLISRSSRVVPSAEEAGDGVRVVNEKENSLGTNREHDSRSFRKLSGESV